MTDTLRVSAEQLADVIQTRGDAVRETLATRLAAFEEMFNHSGAELGEKISRDSSTLANLITRHLAEFDRTVKTYGSRTAGRTSPGARTQSVAESVVRPAWTASTTASPARQPKSPPRSISVSDASRRRSTGAPKP